MDFKKGLIKLGSSISKRGPAILTGVGIFGLITAGVIAVKNTPKAVKKLDESKENDEEVTVITAIKLCWKSYIFPVTLAIISILCIIFARKIDSGRTAALLTACKISEEAAEKFENETREVVGEKGVEKIKDQIAKKELVDNPISGTDVYLTGSGTTLYYESYSGRYFRANRDFVDKACNVFNSHLQDYDTMSVNDYLECFDLPSLDDMTTGRLLGWRLDDVRSRCGGHLPKLKFVYDEIETGEVCGYMRLEVDPKVKYDSYHS